MSSSMPENGVIERLRSAEFRLDRAERKLDVIQERDEQEPEKVKLANLAEKVNALADEVKYLRRTLVAFAFTVAISSGAILYQIGQQ